jgi:hypothetical protein
MAAAGGGRRGVPSGCGELGVAVSDQEPEATGGVVEVHEQVADLLDQPGAGGVGGDAEDVHSPGGVLDSEERVQPVQGDGKIGQSQPMMAELNESIISAARRAANEAGRTPSTATRS